MTYTAWPAGRTVNAPADLNRRLKRLRKLATLMDAAVVIPGTTVRFGWDAVVGLIPGGGDAVSAAISGYIVVQAVRLGVPLPIVLRMVFNVAVDFVLGTVPVAGDIFDVLWRANLMNVALVERHFGLPPQT
jgi:hypothetical protein